MFFKFSLLFIVIILSGLFTVVALIFSVIYLAGKKNGSWSWLIGFCISFSVLLYSLHAMTTGVQEAVTDVGRSIEKSIDQSLSQLDSTDNNAYHKPTASNSLLDSLRLFSNTDSEIPESFFSYFGFRDYYRLPLTYPFSIHCIDELDNGQLYNEKFVTEFDRNDNGETALNLSEIYAFLVDKNYLVAELKTARNTFVIYYFSSDKQEVYQTKSQVLTRLKQLNFKGDENWKTCKIYFEGLTK
jgi:hypothetical protein